MCRRYLSNCRDFNNLDPGYNLYDDTHYFEIRVYPSGLVEARVWPTISTRPYQPTVSYDYSPYSDIYEMTSRELTVATWVNPTNFELDFNKTIPIVS